MITLPYRFRIKADEDGKAFVRVLRKVVAPTHRVKLRGRGHRHGSRKFRQDLPLSLATDFAVYVETK